MISPRVFVVCYWRYCAVYCARTRQKTELTQ